MPLSPGRQLVLSRVKEKQFMMWIWSYAERAGWLVYHTHNSRRSPSGFPDLFMVRGDRAVALECKAGRGQASPDQKKWIARMNQAGIPAYVVWPVDEAMVMGLLA
jgi:hypothetical protein